MAKKKRQSDSAPELASEIVRPDCMQEAADLGFTGMHAFAYAAELQHIDNDEDDENNEDEHFAEDTDKTA